MLTFNVVSLLFKFDQEKIIKESCKDVILSETIVKLKAFEIQNKV